MALIRSLYPHLENYALAMENDRENALDLVGETLLRAWEHFDRVRNRDAMLSWLYTTARRISQERRRRGRLFQQESPGYADDLLSDIPSPDMNPDVSALYAALRRMPAKEREAIVLFELNELPLKEVLAIQGGTMSALKVRLHRGRKRLARLLGVGREGTHEEGSADETGKSSQQNSTLLFAREQKLVQLP